MLKENPNLAVAAIKQGTWFTKPYWDSFRGELKKKGVSWQILMKAFSICRYNFLRWIEGDESWDNVLNALEGCITEMVELKSKYSQLL